MSSTKIGLGADVTEPDVATDDTALGTAPPPARDSAPTVGAGQAPAGQPARGDSIGRFVVLGLLGSGGMGNVYSAYDPHLDRKVAIKLLHTELARTNAADARTRLLREAQAMAKINHPNVIKVHEVGTFHDQVYVAMEFADAGTLRAWLKAALRARRDILELFVPAGRGLAAAHAAGLVHRDFKPDNVLLAKDGSVRVTDFGLVSVLAEQPVGRAPSVPAELSEAAQRALGDSHITPLSEDLTRTGAVMGTPTYMAPEQFAGGASTARTDQFAFCIALYEALYGERPFSGGNYAELSTAVLLGGVQPPPKGTSVPGWLRRALLRGLAKDPAERHASMDALLAAIGRDPAKRRRTALVLAGPAAAIAIGATLFALQPGRGAECATGDDKVAAVWNAERRTALEHAFHASGRPLAASWFTTAARDLDDWTHAWQQAYVDACEATRVRGEQSDHLLDLRMQCLARRLDDARATVDQITAGGAEAIDHALQALHGLPALAPCGDSAALLAALPPPESPALVAQVAGVRAQLGNARALTKLGRYAKAAELGRDALAAAKATGYAPVVAEAGLVTGQAQSQAGDKTAVATLREALHRAAEAGDEATMLDASAMLVNALNLQTSEYGAAEEVGALAEAMSRHGKPSVERVVRLQVALALLDSRRGKLDAAQARYEQALAAARTLGEDHEATLVTLAQLAEVDKLRGKLDDARVIYERVLATHERLYGKDHPVVALSLNNLGNVYRQQAKLGDAKRMYERALAIRIAALGPEHPEVGTSLNNLGTLYAEAGNHKAARESFEKALALWEKTYGPNSPELVSVLTNIGTELEDQHDFPRARATLERALALVEAAQGKDGPGAAAIVMNLGVVAQHEQHLDEALADFHRAEAIAAKAIGPDATEVIEAQANEAVVLKMQGKLTEATELNTRVLHAFEKSLGPDHTRVGMMLHNLGELESARNRHAEALADFQKALAVLEPKLGKNHEMLAYPLAEIGQELAELKRPGEGVPYVERALAIRIAAGMPPEDIGISRLALGELLGKLPDAASRARAKRTVTAALAELQHGNDAENIAEAKSWLAKHR